MISPLKSSSVELSLNLVCRKRNNWSAKTLLHTLLQTLTWSRCEDPWGSICCSNALPQDVIHLPGLQPQRHLALHFLDNVRVFDGWIVFGTFISQTAWRPGQKANGAKVNVVRCYLWHHYLPPEKQIKSFACLWRCNSLWHGLILWLERKTEGLEHMDCIPNSDVGFFRTWYWESKSITRCIWEGSTICCVHV